MNNPAIFLDTWHRFTEESVKEFVGKDLLILHRKKMFVFLPNATLEGIHKWLDEESMIVDLSSSDYIKVQYIPSGKSDTFK